MSLRCLLGFHEHEKDEKAKNRFKLKIYGISYVKCVRCGAMLFWGW